MSALYRNWLISYDPPPIPVRNCDWQAAREDYDGPGDNRTLSAGSEAALKAEIDAWHDERAACTDLDVVTDHFESLFRFEDRRIVQQAIDRLGLERVFTAEALAEIADHYAWSDADRERRTEDNRPFERAAAGLSPSLTDAEAA